MIHGSANQRMFETIETNRDLIENPNTYQQEINNLLCKIPTTADRINSLSIILQAKFERLHAELEEYHKLLITEENLTDSLDNET